MDLGLKNSLNMPKTDDFLIIAHIVIVHVLFKNGTDSWSNASFKS